jgi:hypothetical protein
MKEIIIGMVIAGALCAESFALNIEMEAGVPGGLMVAIGCDDPAALVVLGTDRLPTIW